MPQALPVGAGEFANCLGCFYDPGFMICGTDFSLLFVVNCREALSFVSVTKFFHNGFHFSCLLTHFPLLRDWLGYKSLLKPPLMRSFFLWTQSGYSLSHTRHVSGKKKCKLARGSFKSLWRWLKTGNKHATCLATLLQNELNSNVACFATHIKPALQQSRYPLIKWAVSRNLDKLIKRIKRNIKITA